MTVKELIEQLQNVPQDYKVILSADPEGNDYLESGAVAPMYAEGDYHYEVRDLEEWEECEEDEPYPGDNCVVIWP